jgi:hypothetical protein
MPITLPELAAHVKEIGWKHSIDEERQAVVLNFGTDNYKNLDGDSSVVVGIECRCDGEYVQVLAPRAYELTSCRYKGATLAALAELSYRTRALQCEYDPTDGEVRYVSDAWVLDNTLTARQVGMLVRMVVECLEEFDPVIRLAMETGRIDFSVANPRQEQAEGAPEPIPEELRKLVEQAGGVEALRKALEEAQRAKGTSGAGA